MSSAPAKTAVLHRMLMDKHICPFGLKSLALLRREGFEVDDRWLTSREAVEAFKAAHNVKTTPQTFIDGARIGGYDDLRRHFGLKVRDPKALTYKPVIAVFGTAALMAAAADFVHASPHTPHTFGAFIAFSMCLLALLKLRDVETFSNTFLGYDLLARRWIPYAYIYPFAELAAGVLMIAGALTRAAAPLALFIGSIGAVSVIKAVYIDKRELKCACVGGDANVPLGLLSLTENLMMIGMALWMLATL